MKTARLATLMMSTLCLGATMFTMTSCSTLDDTLPHGPRFHVSPDGDDQRDGGSPETAFRTLERAQAAVRACPDRGKAPITVLLRGGTYERTTPWTFTPDDSGTPNAPITWRQYRDEKPVISGGRRLTGWTVAPDGTWSLVIPEARDGSRRPDGWNINQLFVNGQRRPCARLPKGDAFFRMNGRPTNWNSRQEASKLPGSFDQLVFHDADLRPAFTAPDGSLDTADVTNAIMVVYNSWTASVHHLESIDFDAHRIKLTKGTSWPMGHWEKTGRYHLENLHAAMTEAGEWYMDHRSGTLHYRPMPGETPANTTVIAPVASHVLDLTGDADAGLYVQSLVFSGLSFQHTRFHLPYGERDDGQAAAGIRGAIRTTGTIHCLFRDIEVAHTGTYGIDLGRGTRHTRVERAELHDLGAGGVRIGEPNGERNPNTACGYNTVDNTLIHNGGLIARAAVGYIVFKSSHNTLSHSEICDLYYSAVSLGWSWGYAPSSANHNVVENCHLHHLGYGVLSDMGAVYTLGISPGTVIRNNHIHDIFSYSYGGWGLYTDEGSTDVVMENNLVYNTKSGGFHQHYGRDNLIRNNILAFAREGQVIRSRQEAHRSFTFENNVVIFDNGRPYGGNWGNGNYLMRNNIYWDTTQLPFGFAGIPADEWFHDEQQEQGSRIVDPGFRSPAQFDFSLLPDAPAAALVAQAAQTPQTAGLYGDPAWTQKPRQLTFKALSPDMIPVSAERPHLVSLKELVQDFADCRPGDKAPLASTNGENDELQTSIRVSDELPVPNGTGKALKFVDAPGQRVSWQPHLVYGMHWRKGTVTGEFDCYLNSPDALLWHEWRDSSSPYKVGPSIRLHGDGRLEHGNKRIGTIPLKTWLHVRITTAVGPDGRSSFDLEVTPQGAPTQTYRNLPNGSPDWNMLTWLGFVSESDKRSDFYLANLNFQRR